MTGFANGLIRIYPLEDEEEEEFDLSQLDKFWSLNMHDNTNGTEVVSCLTIILLFFFRRKSRSKCRFNNQLLFLVNKS